MGHTTSRLLTVDELRLLDSILRVTPILLDKEMSNSDRPVATIIPLNKATQYTELLRVSLAEGHSTVSHWTISVHISLKAPIMLFTMLEGETGSMAVGTVTSSLNFGISSIPIGSPKPRAGLTGSLASLKNLFGASANLTW